jgi:hypothetical protein
MVFFQPGICEDRKQIMPLYIIYSETEAAGSKQVESAQLTLLP